jgi:hypothetical protein
MASLLVTFVLVILVVGVVGGGAILLSGVQRRRDDGFASTGDRFGMSFSAAAPTDFSIAPISGFNVVTRGRPVAVENVMRGQPHGLSLAVFDYVYQPTVAGIQTQRRPVPLTCTVAWHSSPGLRLPSFRAHPEGVVHAIGGMIGYADVDLPAQPYFSDSYVLLCADEGRRLIEGPIAGFLERLHANTVDVAVEGAGDHAVFYSWHHGVEAGDVQDFVDHAVTFFTLLHSR